MRWAAAGSIALAAMLILIPWQICSCGEGGPHLELLWAHTECSPSDAPESGDSDSDSEPDCDTLFTFDACPAAGATAHAAPGDTQDVGLAFLARGDAHPSWPLDGPRTNAEPPDPGRPASHVTLVTPLLI